MSLLRNMLKRRSHRKQLCLNDDLWSLSSRTIERGSQRRFWSLISHTIESVQRKSCSLISLATEASGYFQRYWSSTSAMAKLLFRSYRNAWSLSRTSLATADRYRRHNNILFARFQHSVCVHAWNWNFFGPSCSFGS